jgi:hypothetical protein
MNIFYMSLTSHTPKMPYHHQADKVKIAHHIQRPYIYELVRNEPGSVIVDSKSLTSKLFGTSQVR